MPVFIYFYKIKLVKKILAIIFFISLLLPPVFSATQLPEYEPYKKEEFKPWMEKLRRAEIIAFGATALTYPIVGLTTSSFIDDSKPEDFLKKMGISLSLGAVIALVDFLIGEVSN